MSGGSSPRRTGRKPCSKAVGPPNVAAALISALWLEELLPLSAGLATTPVHGAPPHLSWAALPS